MASGAQPAWKFALAGHTSRGSSRCDQRTGSTSLLGTDGWLYHDRESWVWIAGRFVPYPFQLNLHRLPVWLFNERKGQINLASVHTRSQRLLGQIAVELFQSFANSNWSGHRRGRSVIELYVYFAHYLRRTLSRPYHSTGGLAAYRAVRQSLYRTDTGQAVG